MIMMYQCRFINYNKYTALVKSVDNMRSCVCVIVFGWVGDCVWVWKGGWMGGWVLACVLKQEVLSVKYLYLPLFAGNLNYPKK